MNAPTRPILRWHGGKWLLAPWIISNLPPHRIYCEPFAGAASVLMRKPRSYGEVINDLDGEVINFYQVLRDKEKAEALCRALQLTPYSREEFELSYRSTSCAVERARRTVVRASMGIGTYAQIKKTGFRATPGKGVNSPNTCNEFVNYPASLSMFHARLQGVVIENRDALEVIAQQDSPQTLFYVDPPYVFETRDSGTDYAHEMTDEEHRRLAESLRSVKGMVVLSGYPCPLYDEELYPDWHRVEREALADGARKRTEVLWINPAAMAQRWGLGL